jgi:hypothetical protein
MKVLFAIPHYYKPVGTAPDGREHGSIRRDPQPRIAALSACLTAIRRTCAPKVCVLSHADRQARLLIPPEPIHTDVVICTVGGDHLLDSLPPAVRGWHHHATAADPLLLGYECHAVLRDRLGRYDFYCYLEDDNLLTDPGLFRKLVWFNQLFGDARLLQPNRFEVGNHPLVDKMYVDGDLPATCTATQKATLPSQLTADVLGRMVTFRTTTNPHSGCFFLSATQMERWARVDYFLDRSTAFIGALESAATLGVMRTFEVFKPGPENADFFEVRHHGSAYLNMVATGPPSPAG